MLCVALALTRQVLYRLRLQKEDFGRMAMNEFDEHLQLCNDIPRIISETIQLENYIFKKDPP